MPELRNTLIVHLRFADPVKSFKSQLKTYLFTQASQKKHSMPVLPLHSLHADFDSCTAFNHF